MKFNFVMFGARSILNNGNSDKIIKLTDKEREKLKAILLEICNDIFRFCEKHNLQCMLGGGSALGSVRHGGFIPWDDDIDLMMPRSDYDCFAQLFPMEYDDKYELFVPDGKHHATVLFMKVSRRGTQMESIYSIRKGTQPGIAIDIFPIDNVPENPVIRAVKGAIANVFSYSVVSAFIYQNRTDQLKCIYESTVAGKINYQFRLVLGALISFKSYMWWYRHFDLFVQGKRGSSMCGIPTGRKHYSGEILDKSVFFPPKRAMFEKIEVWVPADVDTYLTNLYGDYMTIPPESKREKHYYTKVMFGSE